MNLFKRTRRHFARKAYLNYLFKHCIRVENNALVMYYNLDNEKRDASGLWRMEVLVRDLPFGYPEYGVNVIDLAATGKREFFLALLFKIGKRNNSICGDDIIRPVIVFWNQERGFWWEQFTTEPALVERIGEWNWKRIKGFARFNWNMTFVG
jgi:hypothetical protein